MSELVAISGVQYSPTVFVDMASTIATGGASVDLQMTYNDTEHDLSSVLPQLLNTAPYAHWLELPDGDAEGNTGTAVYSVATRYEGKNNGDGTHTGRFFGAVDTRETVTVVQAASVVSATGVGGAVDLGAVATGVGAGWIQITGACLPMALGVRIEHSNAQDFSTNVETLIQFTQADRQWLCERVEYAGTCQRYLRAAWEIQSSNPEPAAAFHVAIYRG
jgi:hypothetical protein